MTWNSGEPMYGYYHDQSWLDRDGRQLHDELAPVTFREPPFYDYRYYYQPDFRYNYPDARFDRDGRQNHELVPVQPFNDDVRYRRAFRDHHWHPGHGSHMIPHREQVFLRREDVDVPWWYRRDHYPNFVVEGQQPAEPVKSETIVELYAPQLCCDSCERRVVKAMKNMTGVKKVTADQWNKKVSVLGTNLRSEAVLYHLQHDIRMDRSVLWQDRRG